MGDRDRPDGRPDVGLGGDGLDGPVNAGPVNAGPVNAGPVNAGPVDAGPSYGVDTLVLRLEGMPSPPRPAAGRMARLRPRGNPR